MRKNKWEHISQNIADRLDGTVSLLCWVQRSWPMLGGVWLLSRVSLVFVVNSSVLSFMAAAVLMMPACVELCEKPLHAGHYLGSCCLRPSSKPIDSIPIQFSAYKTIVWWFPHIQPCFMGQRIVLVNHGAHEHIENFFYYFISLFHFSIHLFCDRMFIFPIPIF